MNSWQKERTVGTGEPKEVPWAAIFPTRIVTGSWNNRITPQPMLLTENRNEKYKILIALFGSIQGLRRFSACFPPTAIRFTTRTRTLLRSMRDCGWSLLVQNKCYGINIELCNYGQKQEHLLHISSVVVARRNQNREDVRFLDHRAVPRRLNTLLCDCQDFDVCMKQFASYCYLKNIENSRTKKTN